MILSKDVLVNNIVTELSDNSTGQISPYDIRHNLLDIIDSVHLLTRGYSIDSPNFSTRPTRSVRVGEDALSKVDLPGYFSIDNTAVGHSALKANYQGVKNTAVGSNSLFCNIYGENNAAFGYGSLGGNTIGYNNVGLGGFTLNNNKTGSLNIAIGHAAGYYATNESNKLFIASHNVNSDYICDNPEGSGLTPLVYGDLSSLKFGIAVRSLHSEATVQVSGNISPAYNELSNLGSSNYKYRYLYLASGIIFDNNLSINKHDNLSINTKGHLVPFDHNIYNLGSSNNLWSNGYFNNIYVSGIATINRFVATENCNYLCKTITFGNTGTVSLDGGGPNDLYDYSYESNPTSSACGYLSDNDLINAGFQIQSSGASYFREYYFTFSPPNANLSCLHSDTPFSRASWNSNISLHLASGVHLQTDRIIFPSSINIVNSSGCFGIFSRGNGLFFSKSELVSQSQSPENYLAGVGDVNFYATSGDASNYIFNVAVPDSGTNIKYRLLTGVKQKSFDTLNNNADKLMGFEFEYFDNSLSYINGPSTDRLVIGSYHNTSKPINALTIMKNNDSEGIVGINNLSPLSQNLLPVTSLNVRSATNAIGRFAAENQGQTRSAIQLVGGGNCLRNGFESAYLNGSGLADLSIYRESGKEVYIRFYQGINNNANPDFEFYRLGILNTVSGGLSVSGDVHGMVSIGSETNNYASISMREYTYGDTTYAGYPSKKPDSLQKRGIFFVGQKISPSQSHSMFMIDGSGNTHDLVINKFDTSDPRSLYSDNLGNTFAGLHCPDFRHDLSSSTFRNTGFGYQALNKITSGDDNTAIGYNAGSGITNAIGNILIGSKSATSLSSGINNIVLGYNSFNNTTSGRYNIIIGSDGVGNGISGDYNFILGNQNTVLLHGVLGPNNINKVLNMPSGGSFVVYDNTNADALRLKANEISVLDFSGSDYPDNSLLFSFVGQSGAPLLTLNHAAVPMSGSATYESPSTSRPYAQLEGDIKLRGSIRFSDSTSLSSSSFLTTFASGIQQNTNDIITNTNDIQTLFGSFVEGYVNSQINAPVNANNPTTGTLYTKNSSWANVGQINLVNRDITSVIHSGAYVIAIKVNNEFRPIWISAKDTTCQCCR